MLTDIPVFTDLFWLFFSITTGILMLWIAIALKHLRTGASRALLISASLDLPCSILSSLYWNIWPMGGWLDTGDDYPSAIDHAETIVSNLSTLLFLIWMVSLLFVALRGRQEFRRIRELQQILEQKIGHDSGTSTPPTKPK